MIPEALFITGTDTGVGKTAVAAAIALNLKEAGLKVAAFKPVQSGNPSSDGQPSDAEILFRASSLFWPEDVCVYSLKRPLAPAVAAEFEGTDIDTGRIVERFRRLKNQADVVIVEGVGGLMVPIRWDYSVLDLIEELAAPALIVARVGLGTINHTALTHEALKTRRVETLAVVLNGSCSTPGLDEQTNPDAVRRMTGLNRVVVLPRSSQTQPWAVAQELAPLVGDIFSDADPGFR